MYLESGGKTPGFRVAKAAGLCSPAVRSMSNDLALVHHVKVLVCTYDSVTHHVLDTSGLAY